MNFDSRISSQPKVNYFNHISGMTSNVTSPEAPSGSSASVSPSQAGQPNTMSIWKAANNPTPQPNSPAANAKNVWQAAWLARKAGSKDEMVQLLSAIEREAAKSGITPAEVGKAMSKGYVRGPGGVLHLINRIVSKNHGKVPQDIAVLAQSMGLNLGQDSLKSAANAGQSATAQGSGSGTNAATYGQLLRQEFQASGGVRNSVCEAVY